VDPNNARGFADKSFHMGDLDSVNVFNGNLVVRLPIGGAYPVGPSLKYQLILTNNSKVWDYEYVAFSEGPNDPERKRRAIPERESNSGLGWSLSLGRLIPPRAETLTTPGNGWIYLGSDGSQHEFFGNVTTDNSYLRLTLNVSSNPTVHRVEFPDGTQHDFEIPSANAAPRLTAISDRFGNWVKVSYSTVTCETPGTGSCEQWTITDGATVDAVSTASTRSHTVTFKNEASKSYGAANFQQVVSSVKVAAFGATTATYTFRYEDDAASTSTQIQRGGCGDTLSIDSTTVNVPLLTSVTLPDGSTFTMDYQRQDAPSGGSSATCSSGALTKLTLPTRGRIEWAYSEYDLPLQDCNDVSWFASYGGVTKRSFFQPGATTTAELWTYAPAVTPRTGTAATRCNGGTVNSNFPLPPQEYSNTVVNPVGDKTVNYFSAYPSKALPQNGGVFKKSEYGLPLTRVDELESGGRALSTVTYDCGTTCGVTQIVQKTYVEYENDGQRADGTSMNSRPKRRRVVHVADAGCGSTGCRVDTDDSDFDGFGHYRKTLVTSNFPSAVDHTTFTNYNPGSSATGKDASGADYFGAGESWILQTNDYSWVKEGASAAMKSISDFDSATGVLKSFRTLSGGLGSLTDPGLIATGSSDLLTLYCSDAATTAGKRGFITSERLLGGDHEPIPDDNPQTAEDDRCTTTVPPPGHYFLNHAYTFAGADLTKHTAGWAGAGFLNLDVDLDPATGLTSTSRDSAGVAITNVFDAMGRLREVHPPSTAWTRYVYDPALSPHARVQVQLWAYGASPVSDSAAGAQKDDYFYYDGFGRLILSKSRMPSATAKWAATKTEYDGDGRIAVVSVPMERTASAFEDLTPTAKTVLTYDVFGRSLTATAPDGAVSQTAYTGDRRRDLSVIDPPTPAVSMPASRLRSTEEYDGRGRLVKVTEPSGNTSLTSLMGTNTTTTYGYDVADRLVSASTIGTATQTRYFAYDNRGWLKSEQHPEKGTAGNGTVVYGDYTNTPDAAKGHDAAGLVWYRVEGSGAASIATSYSYDSAQRLVAVTDGAGRTMKTFEFATANSGSDLKKGKLSKAVRYNYLNAGTIVVTETYQYAGLGGRASQRDTKVEHTNGSTTTTINQFSQTIDYEDVFGLPKAIGYPTCSASVGCAVPQGLTSVGQVFDKGALKTVSNFATLSYDATGMISQVQRTTPVTSVDTYANDTGMARPGVITFGGLSTCSPPAQPQIQSLSSVCPSSTGNSASVVNPPPGVTYTWTVTGAGSMTSSTNAAIQFSANASGTITVTVTATNGCGSVTSAPRTITVTGPTATLQAAASIDRGQTATLSVLLTGTAPWNLLWSDGFARIARQQSTLTLGYGHLECGVIRDALDRGAVRSRNFRARPGGGLPQDEDVMRTSARSCLQRGYRENNKEQALHRGR
jgi:hypothetical protein